MAVFKQANLKLTLIWVTGAGENERFSLLILAQQIINLNVCFGNLGVEKTFEGQSAKRVKKIEALPGKGSRGKPSFDFRTP